MSQHPTYDGDRQEEVKNIVGEDHLHPDVDECVDETVASRQTGPERENYEVALISQTYNYERLFWLRT